MAAPKNPWVENALDFIPGARFLANTGSVLSGQMPSKEDFQSGYVGMIPGAAVAKGIGLAAKAARKVINPTKAEAAAAAINKLIKQKQVAVNMPRSAFDKMMAMRDPQYLTQLDGTLGHGVNSPVLRRELADQTYGAGANPISGFLTTKNPKSVINNPALTEAEAAAKRVKLGSTPNATGGNNPGMYGQNDLVTLFLNKEASKGAQIFPGDTGALHKPLQPRSLFEGKVLPTSDFVEKYLPGWQGNYIEAQIGSIKPSDIAKIAARSPQKVQETLKNAGLNIPVKEFKDAVKDPNKLQTLIAKAQQKAAAALAKRDAPYSPAQLRLQQQLAEQRLRDAPRDATGRLISPEG